MLVRVVQLTPHVGLTRDEIARNWVLRGRVLVLKSWWGAFSEGRVVQVAQAVAIGCSAACVSYYPLHAGDELLIFTHETEEPIYATMQSDVWPAAESQAELAALDRAVKERPELDDPQAPERYRVMVALKKCSAAASMHAKYENAYSPCKFMYQFMNPSSLIGIRRSELVEYWGSPTWCQDLAPSGPKYWPPTGADCPPEEGAIWSVGPFEHPGKNVWCDALSTATENCTFMAVENCTL
jgi:hypothetical protein